MQKSLIFLGQFHDEDINWFIRNGKKRILNPEEELIRLGVTLNAMFIVLDGHLSVRSGPGPETEFASTTTGDVLGEVSFVDSRPPIANVVAKTRCVVLEVPRPELRLQLERQPLFAARFYRAMAMFLADRLRETATKTESEGPGSTALNDAAELSAEMLDHLHLAGNHFDRLRQLLNAE